MKDLIFEEFEKNGEFYERTKTILKREKGPRGVIEFSDMYQQKCSLQDSSLATEAAIWLGIHNTGPQMEGPNGQRNQDIRARMHLTQEMVKQLLPFLTEFAKTGKYIAEMKLEKPKKKKSKK